MLNFSSHSFRCILADDALLPQYKGSTFRGAFGYALKKVVCALKNKECSDCLLSSRCIYSRIFELQPGKPGVSHVVTPPHPYIIEPDPSTRTRYSAGDSFCFNLVLFGEFTESLPYFIYAVESMGEAGIGNRNGSGRARFSIADVSDEEGVSIYNAASRRMAPAARPRSLPVPLMSEAGPGRLTLSVRTPLRFKNDNRLADTLTFQEFIRASLRRVSAIHGAFGAGDPPLDYRTIVAEAALVKTAESTLAWHDWKRYSNRQHEEMLFGGVRGNISFVGKVGGFMQIVEQAQVMHVGKQTTFGLGAFDYRWEPEN